VTEERAGALLRVFIGDSDRAQGRPLHQVLVERAHAAGVAAVTVLHGPMGFGRHSRVHSAKLIEAAAHDLPIVIELVGDEATIRRYLSEVDPLLVEGLATLEKVTILRLPSDPPAPRDAGV